MSKIVSVTRVLDEDDIIEAFVRHHAAHIDEMLFLDNGSSDRTLEILRALQDEGFPIKLFQNRAVTFDEIGSNIWFYQVATQVMRADWVAPLDVDEFIATPNSAPLATLLPEAAQAFSLRLVNYAQMRTDDPNELVVPWRIRWRFAGDTGVDKVLVRGGLNQVIIDAGNHCAYAQGQRLAAPPLPGATLAHYPRRNGWQLLQKCANGRLRALAGGQLTEGYGGHYTSPYETLRDTPGLLLRNPGFFAEEFSPELAIEAPFAYLGGPLVYTEPGDPQMKALTTFLHFTERLARQHGRLMDEVQGARPATDGWSQKRDFLF